MLGAMNWKTLIDEIRARKLTLQQIADEVGMSKGAVHDLTTGRGKSVIYETGVRLVALHKRVMRRKAK
jgi:DNA-binding Xre family transcriptional regulator